MRIEGYSAQELFDRLNDIDETENVEAKSLSEDSARSIMETVCSFSNEPGLGGGVILLGVAENSVSDFPRYVVDGIADTDKAQLDFATQCASMFNFPVRPEIFVEKIRGKNVLRIFVPELPAPRKPLYFKNDGIPKGIFRRIGSSDQHCSEEDLPVFYAREEACDHAAVPGTGLADIDEEEVARYRRLRAKVRPDATELSFDTPRLLKAIGCLDRTDSSRLNLAGALLFGSAELHRQLFPAVRVDYLRVPGTEWVRDPEKSFIATEIRGPLLSAVFRAMDAVRADLPRGFVLQEGDIQAQSTGLPSGALREAIVNALMHRSYRVNRPTQVIRYDNRIEIVNAGYSLKPEEELGQPGSQTRNPLLADIFHELNLAEEKGTGIRRMQRLMQEAHLPAPTFESNRASNTFTARFLLHHFLGDEDLAWLARYKAFRLDDNQKKALVFARELGAIDNSVYRQFSGLDTLRASADLRKMRQKGLLAPKGKGVATYYVPGPKWIPDEREGPNGVPDLGNKSGTMGRSKDTMDTNGTTVANNIPSMANNGGTMGRNAGTMGRSGENMGRKALGDDVAIQLSQAVAGLRHRMKHDEMLSLICTLCSIAPLERLEITKWVRRDDRYVRRFLAELLKAGRVRMTIPDMPRHPRQAYVAVDAPPPEGQEGGRA